MTTDPARAGRPRDPDRDRRLIAAAQELLAEVGYDRLTMDAVAARAGMGKATAYRRWSGKAALVADAVAALQLSQPLPDTGSVREDLLVLASTFIDHDTHRNAVIAGLVTAMARDPHLREVASTAFDRPRFAPYTAVIEAAVTRGEVDPGVDVPLLAGLYPAMAFHHVAALGGVVDAAFAHQVIDGILMPLLTSERAVAPS